jgi:hypothetical protein
MDRKSWTQLGQVLTRNTTESKITVESSLYNLYGPQLWLGCSLKKKMYIISLILQVMYYFFWYMETYCFCSVSYYYFYFYYYITPTAVGWCIAILRFFFTYHFINITSDVLFLLVYFNHFHSIEHSNVVA